MDIFKFKQIKKNIIFISIYTQNGMSVTKMIYNLPVLVPLVAEERELDLKFHQVAPIPARVASN